MERKHRRKHLNYRKIMIFCLDVILTIVLIAVTIRFFSAGPKGNAPVSVQNEPGIAENGTEPQENGEQGDIGQRFGALAEKGVNPVAWLSADGTALDYPVVQNVDDEYYMTRNVYGEKDVQGAISLDSRNSSELLDGQIILYGNAMSDGTMFGSLVDYRDQAYYDGHPTMKLETPTQSYTVHIYSAHLTSPEMANYPTWFDNDTERRSFINANIGKSYIAAESDVPDDVTLITLVTNSDYTAGADSRFAVRGYLTAD